VVPEDGRHDAYGLDAVGDRNEAERLGQPGGGVALVVGHAEPAAHQEIESLQPAIADDGEQSDVLRPDIHAVVVRQPHAGLELSRQVAVAVERLLLFRGDLFLAVQPDLVIGAGGGAELTGDGARHLADSRVIGVAQWGGAAHDVALHVAACGDGGEQLLVHARDGGLEVAHEYAVELKSLPGGDPEGMVAMLVGDLLQTEVLLGGDRAGGNGDPHHEAVGLAFAGRLPRPAEVPVVLLVGPVKLEQADVVLAEASGLRAERLRDGAAKMPPLPLGDLDLRFLADSGCHQASFLTSSRPLVWSPHSVLLVPDQRPARE